MRYACTHVHDIHIYPTQRACLLRHALLHTPQHMHTDIHTMHTDHAMPLGCATASTVDGGLPPLRFLSLHLAKITTLRSYSNIWYTCTHAALIYSTYSAREGMRPTRCFCNNTFTCNNICNSYTVLTPCRVNNDQHAVHTAHAISWSAQLVPRWTVVCRP